MLICQHCAVPLEENANFCDSCGKAVSTHTPTDPLLGRVLLNQYVIRSILGSGGFGSVYLAEQPAIQNRKVAIKVLHRHLSQNISIARRFQREANAAAQLEHRSAIKIYNFGETEDGFIWMAMEFLHGKTLDDHIRSKGTLSLEETIGLIEPICEVLQEAHDANILHRDLKPQNIFLAQDKKGNITPKLLDFGIAGLQEENQLTNSAQIMGTPQYMSPEHWSGAKYTTKQSDIYSLGVILYQCLSGKLPFDADTPPLWMQKHCLEAPKDLSTDGIPRRAQDVIFRCLEKKPEHRHPSMTALIAAMHEALNHISLLGSAVTRPLQPLPEQKNNTPKPTQASASTQPSVQTQPESTTKQNTKTSRWIFAVGVGLISSTALAWLLYPREQHQTTDSLVLQKQSPQTQSQQVAATTPASVAASSQTSNLSPEERAVALAKINGERFAVVGNGTVIDLESGLMWADRDSQQDKGQETTSIVVASYLDSYTVGGYKDWRLPKSRELKDLYSTFAERSLDELEQTYWSNEKTPNLDALASRKHKEIVIQAALWAEKEEPEPQRKEYITLDFTTGELTNFVFEEQDQANKESFSLPVIMSSKDNSMTNYSILPVRVFSEEQRKLYNSRKIRALLTPGKANNQQFPVTPTPDHPANAGKIQKLLAEAQSLFASKQYEEASQKTREALALDPENEEAKRLQQKIFLEWKAPSIANPPKAPTRKIF